MYVAFYKSNTGIFSKLVRWWTNSDYSHCEFIFDNRLTFGADFEKFKTLFSYTDHPTNEWDVFELNLTPEEEKKIMDFCLYESDCKYDIIGIVFTQILPLSFENPWWWFCSEICVAGLQKIGEFQDVHAWEFSPKDFYKLLQSSDRIKTNWKNTL